MNTSPAEDALRVVLGLSQFFTVSAIAVTIAISLGALFQLSNYNDSKNAFQRRTRYVYLREARIARVIATGVLSLILLVLNIANSITFATNLANTIPTQTDYYFSDAYFEEDEFPLSSGPVLSQINHDVGWMVIMWMIFMAVLIWTIVQLVARPWKQYEDTIDGVEDEAWEQERKLRKRIRKLTKELRALQEPSEPADVATR